MESSRGVISKQISGNTRFVPISYGHRHHGHAQHYHNHHGRLLSFGNTLRMLPEGIPEGGRRRNGATGRRRMCGKLEERIAIPGGRSVMEFAFGQQYRVIGFTSFFWFGLVWFGLV